MAERFWQQLVHDERESATTLWSDKESGAAVHLGMDTCCGGLHL